MCDAACMQTYVICISYQYETRHGHYNVFDFTGNLCEEACPSAYRVPPHSERRSKQALVCAYLC